MSTTHDPDQQFHDNLRAAGGRIGVPSGASRETRNRCRAALHQAGDRLAARAFRFVRRPAFLSTVGAAASIALIFGFFYLPNGAPQVDAAVILEKLNLQIQESPLIEITMESVTIDELSLNGRLQVGKAGVAGDLQVTVGKHGGAPQIEVDLALGLAPGNGWVLIRKLQIPDNEAARFLQLFFSPGTETLIKLPDEELDFDTGLDLDVLDKDGITEVVQGLIASHSDVGATVTEQPDGTILLTLQIKDASTIRALGRLNIGGGGNDTHGDKGPSKERCKIDVEDLDDLEELYGITLKVVYDPKAESVRSLVIENIGETDGRISIAISEGEIDPALLDADRVTNENTRVLDLAMMQRVFEGFSGKDADDEED